MYSSSENEFAFSVTDEGIGIRKSLVTNPYHENISDDQTALVFCVKPGVTRSWRHDPSRSAEWQNSGFGLYMVSSIAKRLGRFEIASGNAKLVLKENFPEYKKDKVKGTQVIVQINNNIKCNTDKVIKEVSIEGNNFAMNSSMFSKYAKIKTASKVSVLIDTKKKK